MGVADSEVKILIDEAIFNKLIRRGSPEEKRGIIKSNPQVVGIIYDGRIKQTILLPDYLQKFKSDISDILLNREQELCDSLRRDKKHRVASDIILSQGIDKIVLIKPQEEETYRPAYSKNIINQLNEIQPGTWDKDPIWAFNLFFDYYVLKGYTGVKHWFNELAKEYQSKSNAIKPIEGTLYDVFHGDGKETITSYGNFLRLMETYETFGDKEFLFQATLELYKTMRHNWACVTNELKLFVWLVQNDQEFRDEHREIIGRYVGELGHHI